MTVTEAVVTGCWSTIIIYFIVGWIFFLSVFMVLIMDKSDEASDFTHDMADELWTTFDVLGWKPTTYALVVGIMWLPILAGWRMF